MPEMTDYKAGTFCWADLATTDAEAARAFYTGLFGWTAVDVPTDQGVPYTMLHKGGKKVCALFPLAPGMGTTPRWQSYIAVADVEAAANSAAAMGGKVCMAPMDVMRAGRMAAVQDSTGAAVNLWQAGEHAGAEILNEPGAQCWHELQTIDKPRAARFYGGLFGWITRVSKSVMEGRYDIFVLAGREVGGMLQIQRDWGPVPPNWTVYFGVESCDGATAEAKRLGGKLLFPAMEVENVGRFAFLQDPQGAAFAVIQLAHAVT
jgi:predicted enzyme related to lactoylglutathione lyase